MDREKNCLSLFGTAVLFLNAKKKETVYSLHFLHTYVIL